MAVEPLKPTQSTTAPTDADADRLLGIYLEDHRAGAAAGLARARRFAAANSSTFLNEAAREVCRQIAEDVQTLDTVIERFDHHPSGWKKATARAAELVGRLKLNGRLRQYSPLSRVLDIELLSAGILTKESLWKTLQVVQQHRPELASIDFDELQRRAQAQRSSLDSHRAATAGEAFVALQG